MFGMGLQEIAVILFIGIVVLGPNKLPVAARQAGKFVRSARGVAAAAQAELRDGLGPDFADLELSDLTPKALIAAHVEPLLSDEVTE